MLSKQTKQFQWEAISVKYFAGSDFPAGSLCSHQQISLFLFCLPDRLYMKVGSYMNIVLHKLQKINTQLSF